MQNGLQKWNLRENLRKENLDYKSQPWRKSMVNGQQESQSQRSTPCDDVSKMTSLDDFS